MSGQVKRRAFFNDKELQVTQGYVLFNEQTALAQLQNYFPTHMVISNLKSSATENINTVVKWLIVKLGWGFREALSVALPARVGNKNRLSVHSEPNIT